MNGNYPPGVTSIHPHFNPPTCPDCGEELNEDDECESCDFTPPPDPREMCDSPADLI